MTPLPELQLADWRRTIFDLYAGVRAASDPQKARRMWIDARDDLFARHPQSPLPEDVRKSFSGLSYFRYDPAARIIAEVNQEPRQTVRLIGSAKSRYVFERFASVGFELYGHTARLDLFWLQGYAGGLFLPFKDAGSRVTTYGGGRYLLDSVKGADLGMEGDRLVLDFNFAYQPSCSYGGRWACPLAPPSNRLSFEVPAGEKLGPSNPSYRVFDAGAPH